MTRLVALILACFFLALAVVGVFLPGLPTVPFLLLAAWFSARGSDRLHAWLYSHPYLGKLIMDWEQQGSISRASKVTALLMLMISWSVLYHQLNNSWGLIAITVLFIAIATFLISRPEPNKDV